MVYLKTTYADALLVGPYDLDRMIRALESRYLNQTCPVKDTMWWSVMHVALQRSAAFAMGLLRTSPLN